MRQGARRLLAPLVLVVLLMPAALASHDGGSGPRSLGGATVPQDVPVLVRLEAEDFARKDVGSLVQDAAATGGTAWKMPKYGLITTDLDVPETGVVWVRVRARGEHPPGLMSTHMHPVVDGEQRGEWDVGPQWMTFLQSIPMNAGRHTFSVDNFNNYHAPAEDRTLVVDWVEIAGPTLAGAPRVGQAAEVVVDGPEVHMAGTGLAQTADADARNRTSWHMWGIGCFVEAVVFDHPGQYRLEARLRGNEREGEGSHTYVRLDGKQVDEYHVGDAWTTRETTLQAPGGASVLEICYDNDYGGNLKRNLWMDEMRIVRLGDAPAPATPSPPTASTPTPPTPGGSPAVTSPSVASPPGGGLSPATPATGGGTPAGGSPATNGTPHESEGGADVPFPPVVLALAILGLAAWATRRRT